MEKNWNIEDKGEFIRITEKCEEVLRREINGSFGIPKAELMILLSRFNSMKELILGLKFKD